MTEQGSLELLAALGDCARDFQEALILKTKTDKVYSVLTDKREWSLPPLRPAGSPSNPLLRLLYGERPLLMADRHEIWDCVVDALYDDHGDPAKLAQLYFPALPFTRAPDSACLPQLLCALSWSGGDLIATRSEARLCFGQGVIEVNQRRLTHRGLPRRLPTGCQVDPRSLLERSLGKPKAGTTSTTAVYRQLAITLPEMLPAIDLAFATAVHAGREHEATLTRLFDVIPVDEINPSSTVWVKARRVINTAVENPLPELWEIMRGTWTLEAFQSLLGNPHRKVRYYPASTRAKHARVIDLAENSEINLQVFKKMGPQQAAAEALLNFQSLMGTSV